jgi:hypothetical protein
VDFAKESGFLQFRDKEGKPPDISAFAQFIPFDENGVVCFQRKALGRCCHRTTSPRSSIV